MNSCEPENKKDSGCKLFGVIKDHFKNHCAIVKLLKKNFKKTKQNKNY